MPVRKFNPTSPGTRFKTVQTFDDITTSEPYKPLVRRRHRLEVAERTIDDGTVTTTLDETGVRRAAEQLKAQ